MSPRHWVAGGLVWLVCLAVAVRVAADLLTPALPLLIVLAALAVIVSRLWRGY